MGKVGGAEGGELRGEVGGIWGELRVLGPGTTEQEESLCSPNAINACCLKGGKSRLYYRLYLKLQEALIIIINSLTKELRIPPY